MGHWNYRIVRRSGVHNGEPWTDYGIHSAHYHGKRVYAVSKEPEGVSAEMLKNIPDILKKMAKALRRPTLDYETRREIRRS